MRNYCAPHNYNIIEAKFILMDTLIFAFNTILLVFAF